MNARPQFIYAFPSGMGDASIRRIFHIDASLRTVPALRHLTILPKPESAVDVFGNSRLSETLFGPYTDHLLRDGPLPAELVKRVPPAPTDSNTPKRKKSKKSRNKR